MNKNLIYLRYNYECKYLCELKVKDSVLNKETDAHGKIVKVKSDGTYDVKWQFSKSVKNHPASELVKI